MVVPRSVWAVLPVRNAFPFHDRRRAYVARDVRDNELFLISISFRLGTAVHNSPSIGTSQTQHRRAGPQKSAS